MGFTQIYPDGLQTNIARLAFITESARSTQENPVEFFFFKIRDGEKKIIKRGLGREGKITFLNHTSSLLVWLEINRMAR